MTMISGVDAKGVLKVTVAVVCPRLIVTTPEVLEVVVTAVVVAPAVSTTV